MEDMSCFGENVSTNEQIEKPKKNRKFKDSFFCSLFSDMDCLFDLYKTLHSEDTETTKNDLEIATLKNVFFTSEYNDLSFLVKGRLIVLAEHQSTISYNITLRLLFYLCDEYRRWISEQPEFIYKRGIVKIPAPEFYVVYTGKEKMPKELRLSDSFSTVSDSLELKVRVVEDESVDTALGCYKS